MICGINLWFSIFIGSNLNNTFSISIFLLIFFGVNLTFFPIHFLGLQGIPRRYRD
ncbi:cbb3-type cytochrome c oxidase subunit I, partial [Shimia sp.]|uniref:cbb3-type cytochrome c oxidase subunit I n=1 Tax=Shimia sp. TaxID=1954381 RepID=UPI00356AA4A9